MKKLPICEDILKECKGLPTDVYFANSVFNVINSSYIINKLQNWDLNVRLNSQDRRCFNIKVPTILSIHSKCLILREN